MSARIVTTEELLGWWVGVSRLRGVHINGKVLSDIAAELIAARTKLEAAEKALQEVAHFTPGAADHPMMIALSMAGIAQSALDKMEAAQ